MGKPAPAGDNFLTPRFRAVNLRVVGAPPSGTAQGELRRTEPGNTRNTRKSSQKAGHDVPRPAEPESRSPSPGPAGGGERKGVSPGNWQLSVLWQSRAHGALTSSRGQGSVPAVGKWAWGEVPGTPLLLSCITQSGNLRGRPIQLFNQPIELAAYFCACASAPRRTAFDGRLNSIRRCCSDDPQLGEAPKASRARE
jgi:hypothetical protein